jgi:hypothetical protein
MRNCGDVFVEVAEDAIKHGSLSPAIAEAGVDPDLAHGLGTAIVNSGFLWTKDGKREPAELVLIGMCIGLRLNAPTPVREPEIDPKCGVNVADLAARLGISVTEARKRAEVDVRRGKLDAVLNDDGEIYAVRSPASAKGN